MNGYGVIEPCDLDRKAANAVSILPFVSKASNGSLGPKVTVAAPSVWEG